MRKFYALIFALCLTFSISAQEIVNLAYFPFTDNASSPNTPTSYLAPFGEQHSTAGLYLDGTHGSSLWNTNELTSNNGSSLNLMYDQTYGKDLALINNAANGKSIVFHFSTLGYQDVVMSMAVRRSAQGFNRTDWLYSTDGVNFDTMPNFSTVPGEVATYEHKTIYLSEFSAINDQPEVYIKCVFDGAMSASASFRMDNISISAYPAGPDIWGPRVNNVSATDSVTVSVHFNEPVNDTTAGNVANYELDNGLVINAISVVDHNMVELKTSEMSEDVTYSLIVRNVEDALGNVMETDTISFSYTPEGGFIHNTNCDNIAQLRANMSFSNHSVSQYSTEVFRLNGEVVVTAVAAYKNQKVIQDETGAILIFDDGNVLDPNGTLEVGDKIRGFEGKLTNYYGFLEFKPTTTFEQKTAIYQEVAPLEITLDQLNDEAFMDQHQAELIMLRNVTFTQPGATFAKLTTYEISQNGTTASAVYPYFQDVDYLGEEVPAGTFNLVGFNFATSKIGNQTPPFRYYIIPRSLTDFVTGIRELDNNVAVYPNPTNGTVVFQIGSPVETVMIYDINGKLVANETVADNRVNVSHLDNGVYFAKLYRQNELLGVSKIVKY